MVLYYIMLCYIILKTTQKDTKRKNKAQQTIETHKQQLRHKANRITMFGAKTRSVF